MLSTLASSTVALTHTSAVTPGRLLLLCQHQVRTGNCFGDELMPAFGVGSQEECDCLCPEGAVCDGSVNVAGMAAMHQEGSR